MRRIFIALFLAAFLGGCFEADTGSPVRGTDMAVIVHNYALAFRDFQRAESPDSFLPAYVLAPLPLIEEEWRADDVTSPVPVTTSSEAFTAVTLVSCSPAYCVRDVERKYTDGFRIDEMLQITYRRGITTTTDDDQVLGFSNLVRYRDQVFSQSAATEPSPGEPWVVEEGYSFPSEDSRLRFSRTRVFPAMTSTSTPDSSKIVYETKDGSTRAHYKKRKQGFSFSQDVTYETFRRLATGTATYQSAEDSIVASQILHYKSGVDVTPLRLDGNATGWLITGDTVAKGAITGERAGKTWRRVVVFPKGQRFKTLTDEGTYAAPGGRGTFTRTIVGQEATLTITGTYKQKFPAVWELTAEATGGIRVQFTYHRFELSEIFAGLWTQPNSRASAPDTAEFQITSHPDWTSRMSYGFDRSDVPFTPDETGTLRFTPDSRGIARVSVVQEKSADQVRHLDYNLAIVAEGQKPPTPE